MTFSVTANPTSAELAEAINYLLANFAQTMAINPNTGNITTVNYGVVSYLYKYLQIKYADSYDGSVNLSNVPTNRLYYGIRNNDSSTESTNPADYLWLPVTGGFGTTKFVWYATTGGRQIELFIGSIPPSVNFFKDNGNAIDLDLLTIAAEDRNDPVPTDHSSQIQALEQAIGSIPQPQLGTMAPINIDSVPYIGFVTPPSWIGSAAGQFWYDSTTGSFNAKMGNNNITQQVGEEIFVYGKASAAITDSPLQIIYHTGVVGASGVITFAPTIAGITDVNSIIGIATESLALNGFGRATVFGVVRGITTNGTAFGEVWADDDVIWYNPITGNPTKVEPVAPYIKVQVGLVIKAGAGGSGSFQVGIARGSKLGGTDSNVQLSAPSNGQILTYDGAATYWKNTTLTAGSGVSISPSAGGVLTVSATGSGGTVTNVSFTGGIITVANPTTTPALTVAGTSGGIPYFSSASTWASSAALTQYGVVYGGGAGATPVATAAGTTGQVLTATTSGAPTWASPATSGTVTSVSVVSANGFAGTVATSTTTPAITLKTSITGLLKGDGTAISAAVANTDYVPLSTVLTKTADYTITGTDTWIINNKPTTALTLTFPAASAWTGRSITVKNMQAQLVNSASSNVVPIDSTTAGTAILLGVIGNWATMVSDGTNWVIMQAASNNNLLLE